jgi:hypothetical protein
MKPTLGVILSDTTFRRPVGDVGNAASYEHPVIFHVAKGATGSRSSTFSLIAFALQGFSKPRFG